MLDRELIEELKARNFEALEHLITEYGEAIIRTVHAILCESHEQSEWEAVENTIFYTIWEKIGDFDPQKASFTTWLLMIARSKAIDQKRKLARDYHEDDGEKLNKLAYQEDDPLAQESFLELVDCLSQEDQQIFLLYYFYQVSPKDIAKTLSFEQSQVYNRLSRGRSKLRQKFAERSDSFGL